MLEKTHTEIKAEFLRADWTTQQLFDKLIQEVPSSNKFNFSTNAVAEQQRLT